MRRLAVASLLTVAATLLPVSVSDPLGTMCASAAGSLSIAVVIDTGDLGGGSPTTTCVSVSDGATGTDALIARSRKLGTAAPRFSAAGFLCGVDGQPSSGCGDGAGSTVAYWSYWWASVDTPTWRYATRGSDARKLKDGMIEGWRYVVGTSSQGSNLAPRLDPSAASCASASPTPATPAAPSAAPAPTPQGSPGGVAVSPATASVEPTADTDPIPLSTAADETSTTVVDPAAPTTTVAGSTTTSKIGGEDGVSSTSQESESADGAAGGGDDSAGGDSVAGPVAAGAVVLASVGLAVVQSRRRRLRE